MLKHSRLFAMIIDSILSIIHDPGSKNLVLAKPQNYITQEAVLSCENNYTKKTLKA